jgi:hypothetical protein
MCLEKNGWYGSARCAATDTFGLRKRKFFIVGVNHQRRCPPLLPPHLMSSHLSLHQPSSIFSIRSRSPGATIRSSPLALFLARPFRNLAQNPAINACIITNNATRGLFRKFRRSKKSSHTQVADFPLFWALDRLRLCSKQWNAGAWYFQVQNVSISNTDYIGGAVPTLNPSTRSLESAYLKESQLAELLQGLTRLERLSVQFRRYADEDSDDLTFTSLQTIENQVSTLRSLSIDRCFKQRTSACTPFPLLFFFFSFFFFFFFFFFFCIPYCGGFYI